MSTHTKYTIDDMNEILLKGDSFFWNDFEVKLIQQKNYEVFKDGERRGEVMTSDCKSLPDACPR